MQNPQSRALPGKIVWRAVLIGFLIDYATSRLVGLVGSEFDPNVIHNSTFASPVGIGVWVLCILSTGIGGLIAGRIAKHERVLHGVMVGGVGLILMLLNFQSETPYNQLDVLLQILATLLGGLGGYLSRWLPSRQSDE